MIQRKTQAGEYWQTFSLSADDVEFLHNALRTRNSRSPRASWRWRW